MGWNLRNQRDHKGIIRHGCASLIQHPQPRPGRFVIQANAQKRRGGCRRIDGQFDDFCHHLAGLPPGCRVAPLAWRRIGLGQDGVGGWIDQMDKNFVRNVICGLNWNSGAWQPSSQKV